MLGTHRERVRSIRCDRHSSLRKGTAVNLGFDSIKDWLSFMGFALILLLSGVLLAGIVAAVVIGVRCLLQ